MLRKTVLYSTLIAFLFSLMPTFAYANGLSCTIKIEPNDKRQIIQGISGNFAKNRMRSSAIDESRGKNDEIGEYCLEHLNPRYVRVGIPLIDFAANREKVYDEGYVHQNFLLMKDFSDQNRTIVASVWDVPDRMVQNPDATVGRLVKEDMYEELADSIAQFVKYAKDMYGIHIQYLSFNESEGGINVLLNGEQYARIIKLTAGKLENLGFGNIKWLAGDTSNASTLLPFVQYQLQDEECRPYIGAISYHSWDVNGISTEILENIYTLGKQYNLPIWIGEVGYDAMLYTKPEFNEIITSWEGASRLGLNYYKNIAYAGASNLFYWQYQWDFNLLDIYGNLYPSYYFVKQLNETLLEGMTVVGVKGDLSTINAIASYKKDKFTVNIWNTADGETAVNVDNIPNGLYHRISSSSRAVYDVTTISVNQNKTVVNMPPKSMVTMTLDVQDNTIEKFFTGSVLEHYITAQNGKLMDGATEFRGIGFNLPGLTLIEDGNPSFYPPNDFEIEDAFDSLSQMGVNVIRLNMLGIRKTGGSYGIPDPLPAHITGIKTYDESTFKAIDKVLEQANKHGIRVIMPGIDAHGYWGGIRAFAALYGKSANEFWTDSEIIDGAKDLYRYMINRVNTYTGIAYGEDKAILAWQLGNEIESLGTPSSIIDEWTATMAAYIKSIDSNHLVADGRHNSTYWKGSLSDPNVDIFDSHFYPEHEPSDLRERLPVDAKLAQDAGKVFMVGEFGFYPTDVMSDFLDQFQQSTASMAMLWSLRFHSRYGGFYFHHEGIHQGREYGSWHWPGFPSGDYQDETNMLHIVRNNAFKIRQLPVPLLSPPKAPKLLPITDLSDIRWQGSAGASSYDIERSERLDGGWYVIGSNITDDVDIPRGNGVLFSDTTIQPNKTYYYRIKAKNSAGESPYSRVVAYDPTSVLKNGGFEDGLNHWNTYGNTVVLTNERSYSGDYSLKVNGVGTAGDNNWSEIYQTFMPLESGVYTISGYIMTNARNPNEAWRTKMHVRPFGGTESDDLIIVTPVDIGLTIPMTDWNYFSFEVTLQKDVMYSFYIKANDGGVENTYYYDDLSIKPKKSDNGKYGENCVRNGSFENGTTDWDSNYWSNGVATIVSDGTSPDGSKHLRMSGSIPNDWFNIHQVINVIPHSDYILKFKGKVLYSESQWNVFLKFTVGGLDGPDLQNAYNLDITKTDWTDYEFEFNTKDNSVLGFYIGGNASTFEVDDIQIRKKLSHNDSTGQEIKVVNIVKTGSLTNGSSLNYEMELLNLTSFEKSVTAVLGIFNEQNMLLDVVYSSTSISANGRKTVNVGKDKLSIPSDGIIRAKILLFESLDNIRPYTGAIVE